MTYCALKLSIASVLVLACSLLEVQGIEAGYESRNYFANMMDFPKACFYTERILVVQLIATKEVI